jgi:hypothetical protein
VRDGRAYVREHPVVLAGPSGSRVNVHYHRGARIEGGRLRLRARWDGLQFRVPSGARSRPLELRIVGRGQGVLYVGEKTFWTEPRWTTYPVAGPFRLRHPYVYAESGGADVIVTIGRAPGHVELESIALVPPGSPP